MSLLRNPLVRGLHREIPDFGRKAGDDKVSRPTVFEGVRPYHTYGGIKDLTDLTRSIQSALYRIASILPSVASMMSISRF